MGTAQLWILVVVIPASAAALLVVALDVRAGRRRRPRPPLPSRLTAAAGAALAAGGFGLVSLAGLGGTAHAAHGPEQLWVATATAGGGIAVVPVDPAALAGLPFAPFDVWGTGFDNGGTWEIVAGVPGARAVTLQSGTWPQGRGEGVRTLGLVDPGPLVDAARAAGLVPQNGAFTLELISDDPRTQVVFRLADRPPPLVAPVPAPASAAANGVPPVTGSAAAAARRPAAAATPAAPSAPVVGVPSTGGGWPLGGGVALLLAGAAALGVSTRPAWRSTRRCW